MRQEQIIEFITQSNRIEGIIRPPSTNEIVAHQRFLELDLVMCSDVEHFVTMVANASLRRKEGMNVRIGTHIPPLGGPEVGFKLAQILEEISGGDSSPWEIHMMYENLHPFMDGNGRSGRVIWLWMMMHEKPVNHIELYGLPPLGFLQKFYYQTLDSER